MAGSFWNQFRSFQSSSALDELLDRDGVTLDEVIDEEELIQECKALNHRLIEFIATPAHLSSMIDYITVEPTEDSGEKRCFKFPFVTAEVFCCEVGTILEMFFYPENRFLLEKLFQFLHSESLNPTLAGYFSRLVAVLLTNKTKEMLTYFSSNMDALTNLLNHIGTRSIMEVLVRLVTLDDNRFDVEDDKQRLNVFVLDKMVEKLAPNHSSEVHSNVAEALVEILIRGHELANSDRLPNRLQSEETVNKILSYVFSTDTSSLKHGLIVLGHMLSRYISPPKCTTIIDGPGPFISDALSDFPPPPPPSSPPPEEDDDVVMQETVAVPFLTGLAGKLEAFQQVLSSVPSEPVSLPHQTMNQPLGSTRLQVLEFLALLLKANNGTLHQEIARLNLLQTSIDLFFQFEWNDFVHNLVASMISSTLECDSDALKTSLLKQSNLIERLVNAVNVNKQAGSVPRPVRKGYMGHVTKIANALQKAAEANETVKSYLQDPAWLSYVNDELKITNETETSTLGGNKPAAIRDSDDELNRVDFDLRNFGTESRISNYLTSPAFSTDFGDEFDDDADPDYDDDFDVRGGTALNGSEQFFSSLEDRNPNPFTTDSTQYHTDIWVERELVDASNKQHGININNHNNNPFSSNDSSSSSHSDSDWADFSASPVAPSPAAEAAAADISADTEPQPADWNADFSSMPTDHVQPAVTPVSDDDWADFSAAPAVQE
eukprot:GILJ01010004.1.p1 GENE.GILJ01010004.1~~GILJ01010004.1.p1  ORF type:complete len:717 (-),score=156.09 GILJ01010004.1:415-2565(-)